MRLRRLEVEHFGVFSGQTFEFHPNFALLFGPNEAGKSTLLQLVREVLFGFKVQQNPYLFVDHAGEMAATATFDLAAGGELRFRRRKGTKGEVVGQLSSTGQEIDAADLQKLLGGATRELYEHVFGFSLRELSQADESLQRANLTEALYGGGLGGLAHFQRVQAELQSEADSLFTPRGRGKQVIHQLLAQIKEQGKELRQHTIKPRDYEQLVDQCRRAKDQADRLRDELEELRRHVAHLDRVARAVPPWLQLQRAAKSLAELSIPPQFPLDGEPRFQKLRERREELGEELRVLQKDHDEASEALQNLPLAPDVVAHEADIRQLQQRITEIEGYRRDLPLRQQESQDVRLSVRAQLRDLHPDWEHQSPDGLCATLVQREAVERLQRESDDLQGRLTELLIQRRAAEAEIAELKRGLEKDEGAEPIAAVKLLVEHAPEYQRDRERFDELRPVQEELDGKRRLLLQRLAAPLAAAWAVERLRDPVDPDAAAEAAVALAVPLPATVAEFRELLHDRRGKLDEAERQARQTRGELQRKQQQLQDLEEHAAVPDCGHLQSLREHRDAGWRLIRRQFLAGQSVDPAIIAQWLAMDPPNESAQLLAERYEQAVTAADDIADERQAKAELAAARDQLTVELQELQERLITDEEAGAARKQDLDEAVQCWQLLWEECPFPPLSPEAMLDWLRLHSELCEIQRQRRLYQARGTAWQKRVTAFESQLAAAFPDLPGPPSRLLARAQQIVQEAHEVSVKRGTFAEQLPRKEETLRQLTAELTQVHGNLEHWRGSWQMLLRQLKFPTEWDVATASKVLQQLTQARSDWDKATTLQRRITDMEQGAGEFTTRVRRLCEDVAPDLASFAPEHAASELHRRLESAKTAERDQARLSASLSKLAKRQADRQQALEQTNCDLRQLLQAAHVDSEEQFQGVAAAVRQFTELTRVEREARDQIALIRGTEDEEAFLAELKAADADSLGNEQDRVRTQEQSLAAQFEAAFKDQTLLEEQRRQQEQTGRAAELAADLESSRSQLATAVDRWATLVLAQAAMKRAIQKFEREHQPALLGDVRRLLSHMTLERYVGLERKLDEQGTLLVLESSGQRKEPHQLSTGTREQLYLAIRLAYLQHYCRQAEPLPIVMDDVLVNFDAERARQTLACLAELSRDVQIIFLTCHQHMVELVQLALPGCEPTVLPGGDLPQSTALARVRRPTTKAARR